MEHGILYLCATPIGNLDDISLRALNTLKSCDLIACEDTRRSLQMLNHYGISAPLTSYFEHNKKQKGAYLIEEMKSGKNVALVTDAGTPAISDPGEDLVKMCIKENIRVVPIPGCAALINALIISGINTTRFAFEGFLSVNKKSRNEHLESLKNDTHTMIFYEAPHKLIRTLSDMLRVFGNRRICIVKELTKVHEKSMNTTFEDALAFYKTTQPKGEYVIIIEGKDYEELKKENAEEFNSISVRNHVDLFIKNGMDKKNAVKEVARLRQMPKREVYNMTID